MSKINDLLLELCPEGVQLLRVDQVCVRKSGLPLTAGEMKVLNTTGGDVRIFAGGQTFADVKSESIDGKYIEGPGLIVKSRGIIDFEFWLGRYSHKNELWSYQPKNEVVNLKFLYYFLKTKVLEVQLIAKANSVKMPQIKVGDIDGMLIPVPPIEIQREIVRILDTFTELEAELEAELNLRKSQQIHYRNLFFSQAMLSKYCSGRVPEYSLGSLLIANRGGGTPSTAKPEYWEGEIPWASIGDMNSPGMYIWETRRTISEAGLSSGATSLVNAGDVLAAVKISPGLMKIASRDVAINQDIRGLTLDPRLDPAFLVYFFRTFSIVANGAIVKGITNATLEKVKVPLPPLDVQHEIVTALNAANELELSLNAELVARRGQYEYYRTKLLSFKELTVA